MTTTLSFQETSFDIIDRAGQIWLQAAEIAKALAYKKVDAITQIYERNKDEFTDSMTLTLNLRVKGFGSGDSEKPVRIFSLRGAHLIAMLARTPVAKAFRKWVLDVLEKETQAPVATNPHLTIRDAVHAAAGGCRDKYSAIYSRLYRKFQVGSYRDITVAQCPAALEYIRSIEGEFIPAKQSQLPLLSSKDALADLKQSLAYFLAPENPDLRMEYRDAQDALDRIAGILSTLEGKGIQLGLAYQQVHFIKGLLSSYWTRLDEISLRLDILKTMASVQLKPSIATSNGVKFNG